jgi:hypothetical protein
VHVLLLFCLEIAHKTGNCSARLLCPLSKLLISWTHVRLVFSALRNYSIKRFHGLVTFLSQKGSVVTLALSNCLSFFSKTTNTSSCLRGFSALSLKIMFDSLYIRLVCSAVQKSRRTFNGPASFLSQIQSAMTHIPSSCLSLFSKTPESKQMSARPFCSISKVTLSAPMSAWLVLLSDKVQICRWSGFFPV